MPDRKDSNTINKPLFYRVTKRHRDYKGDRFFKRQKIDPDMIIQVCVTQGEPKRGKGHQFGIYLIGTTTFFANYLGPGYAEPCTKEEYSKAFWEVYQNLI